MSIFVIGDLHLSFNNPKPMNIFGDNWTGHEEKIRKNWIENVNEQDLVILLGDFSWETYLENTKQDFEYLNKLPGKKILLKGNHDYWWTTMNKLREFTAEHGFDDIEFLQNNSFMYEDVAICGTRGWINPGWDNFGGEDRKIFDREVLRLELSLNSVKECNEIYVFTHYPPMPVSLKENEFVQMMKKYPVTKCIYGHLHAAAHRNAVEGTINGIEYKLVSGDYLGFDPIKLHD